MFFELVTNVHIANQFSVISSWKSLRYLRCGTNAILHTSAVLPHFYSWNLTFFNKFLGYVGTLVVAILHDLTESHCLIAVLIQTNQITEEIWQRNTVLTEMLWFCLDSGVCIFIRLCRLY